MDDILTIELENPFQECTISDMIIKVKEVDIFLNKNIVQSSTIQLIKVEDGKTVVFEKIYGKVWLVKRMDGYCAENVIRFFKFVVPGFNVQLDDDANFQAMLSLCEEFKMDWLMKSVESFLQQRNRKDFSVLQYSIQFSMAERFHLKALKNSLETSFIESFDYGMKEDYLMVAENFELRTALIIFEEKIIMKTNSLLMDTRSRLKLLRLAEQYRFGNLKGEFSRKNINKSWLEHDEFSKLSKNTSFQIIKKALQRELDISLKKRHTKMIGTKTDARENRYERQMNIHPETILILKLTGDIYDHFSKKKQNKTTFQSERKLYIISEPEENDASFTNIPGADIEIEVENTTLELHSWILCQSSPVFKVMLQSDHFNEGRSKKIHIGNRNVSDVIEFFQLLYPSMQKGFHSSRTAFDEILSLSQEYQVEWLTKKIESFIINNFDFKVESKIVRALLLADRFDMPFLKLKLDEIPYCDVQMVKEVLMCQGFEKLSPESKRGILFKIVKDLLNKNDPKEVILKSLQKVLF